MNFYEIANNYIERMEYLEAGVNYNTGEMTEDKDQWAIWKEEIEQEIKQKSANIIAVIRNEDMTIEAIGREIERLTSMKKKKEKQCDNFKEWVKKCMLSYEIEKIETPIGKLRIGNSTSVEIYDEKLIDKKFITIETKEKISKAEIKKAIKAGEEVQGARIVESKHLQIK